MQKNICFAYERVSVRWYLKQKNANYFGVDFFFKKTRFINSSGEPRHRGLGEERTTLCYVLSEGRKIESRCQLNSAIALRSKREEFGLETKQERPPANDH